MGQTVRFGAKGEQAMSDDYNEADTPVDNPKDQTGFIATARKRFQRCVDAFSQNRPFQLDDIRFAAGSPDNGWQWPDQIRNARMTDPNGSRPVLTINKLTQHIRIVVNEQLKNLPQGKVLPVDDKADVEMAEVFNGVIRHIEATSHAPVAYGTASENQVTIGEGYWRILTDYCDEDSFDQDIRIAAIKNSFSCYLDPDGLKKDSVGRFCEYGFITHRMSKEEYKEEFPKAKSQADWEEMSVGEDTFNWFDDEGVMIAEYFYIEEKTERICLLSNGETIPKAEADLIPKELGITILKERDAEQRSVKWAKINGLEVLEARDWAGKYIPIIRIVGNEWEVQGQMVVSGIVRNAKDPQRIINYQASQEVEVQALAPKAPFIGAVGQFETHSNDWRDANTKSFSRLEYDPIDVNGLVLPPPQRQQPSAVQTGLLASKAAANDDLQAVVGQYNPSIGAESKEKSGKAIIARQQQADVGTYHYVNNLARGIAYSTEQLVDLIPKIMDTRRVARILGEDGEADHVMMQTGMGQAVTEQQKENGEIQKIYDPSVGKYDVVCTVGPSFMTKRVESAEFLTSAAQSAKDPVTANVINYLALKSQDWPGAAEAAAMIKRLLPPNVVDEANPQDLDAKAAKIQEAVKQLGQHEAQLQQHAEEIAKSEEQAKQITEQAAAKEKQAQDAMMRAQAKVDEINDAQLQLEAEQTALNAARSELELTKKLIEAQIRETALHEQLKVANATAKAEKAISDKQDAEIPSMLKEISGKLDNFEVASHMESMQ